MKLLIITQKVDENDQLLGFFIGWLSEFSKHFEVVNILCLEKGAYSLPSNVKVFSLGKDRGEEKVVQLFNFYKHIMTLDYDSVLVHMNPIWMVLGGICWRIMGKKAALWYTHKAVTARLKVALLFSQIVFTASAESFRIKSPKVLVTGHGIDVESFKPDGSKKINDGKLRILSVGRIAPVKNYETLIYAAKILKDKSFNFEIVIIGEPALSQDIDYANKLRRLIKDNGLGQYFVFLGKVDNRRLPEYYQSNDLFIHLSKTGSLDKTILEAMACGMQVLSSNDAARAFLGVDKLFKEDDSKELSEKILSLPAVPANHSTVDYVLNNHSLSNLVNRVSLLLR